MVKAIALLCGLSLIACTAPSGSRGANSAADDAAGAAELFERGQQLAAQGDSVRAEQYLAAALRQGHDPQQTLPVLMRVCLTGSRLRAALNHATPYLRDNPEAVWLRQLVATVYLGLGQSLEARKHLEVILTRDPDHGPSHYLMGLTEWQGFGNRVAAREHFRRYLELEPNGPHAAETAEWLRENPERVEVSAAGEASAPAPTQLPLPVPAAAPPEMPAVAPAPEAREVHP